MVTISETDKQIQVERQQRASGAGESNLSDDKTRIRTGVFVVLFALIIIAAWFFAFGAVQREAEQVSAVQWTLGEKREIRPGPPSFVAKKNKLEFAGQIDQAQKDELARLITFKGELISPPDRAGRAYWRALDRLAFISNRDATLRDVLILLLAGLSGLLGAQLRTLYQFVIVASYKNKFEMSRWWPWYVARPFAGFLFGLSAVLLLRVGFFQPESGSADGLSWQLVLAILAGFGANEFAERISLVVRSLFGEGKQMKEADEEEDIGGGERRRSG